MRRRITLLAAATATLAMLLLALPLGVFVSHGYVNDERLELQRAAATAAASLRGDHPAVGSLRIDRSEITASVYDHAGRRIDGPGPTQGGPLVRTALQGTEATGTLGSDIAVAAPISDGDQVIAVVLLRSDLSAAHHRTLIAWLVIAAIGTAAVIISAGAALLLAKRLSAPLERLRHAAHRIGAGDLDARIPLSGVTEFDTLAATLNDSAARIQTMLGRERSLSAEVSHQLRTPLSGLRLELDALRVRRQTHHSARSRPRRSGSARNDHHRHHHPRPRPTRRTDREHRGPHRSSRTTLARPTRGSDAATAGDHPPRTTRHIAVSAPAAAQILDVLLDNACRHGRGAVTIHARKVDGIVAVDVSDEGPALSCEAHDALPTP